MRYLWRTGRASRRSRALVGVVASGSVAVAVALLSSGSASAVVFCTDCPPPPSFETGQDLSLVMNSFVPDQPVSPGAGHQEASLNDVAYPPSHPPNPTSAWRLLADGKMFVPGPTSNMFDPGVTDFFAQGKIYQPPASVLGGEPIFIGHMVPASDAPPSLGTDSYFRFEGVIYGSTS